MSRKLKYNCVVTTGEYTDSEGSKKYSNLKVGIVFEDEKGNLDMKLEAYPLPNSKGDIWIKLFEKKSNNGIEDNDQ